LLKCVPFSIIEIVGYTCAFLICVRVIVFNSTFNSIQLYRQFLSNKQTWKSYTYIYPVLVLFQQSNCINRIIFIEARVTDQDIYFSGSTVICLNCCFSAKHISLRGKQIKICWFGVRIICPSWVTCLFFMCKYDAALML